MVILASSPLVLLWVSQLQLHSQVDDVFSGEVVGVTDGDTVRVMRDRTPVRVRLDGIDAPENSPTLLSAGETAHVKFRVRTGGTC